MKGTRIVQINAINVAWGHVAKGPSFSLLHLLMKPGSCTPPPPPPPLLFLFPSFLLFFFTLPKKNKHFLPPPPPPLSLSLVSLSCWLHMYSMFVAGLLPKKIVLVHRRFKQFGALEKDVCTARYAF